MPSKALEAWQGRRWAELDRLEDAHTELAGPERGRRFVTEQVNHAYAMLLSSQFQGFCRDLHSECVDYLVSEAPSQDSGDVLRRNLLYGRKLEIGNPNPGNIGSDFGRFFAIGVKFWDYVYQVDRRSQRRRERIEDLNSWRNAIAHQDFARVGSVFLRLPTVRGWRQACQGLAASFDAVMHARLTLLVGQSPW